MIKIEKAHKKFNPGTVNEVYALQGVNVHIKDGDFVTIIGTNGSGKTTLLNSIAGTFLLDSGKVFINGVDLSSKPDYKRAKLIARVFQNPFTGTSAKMSIAENLHIAYLRDRRKAPKFGLNKQHLAFLKEEVKHLEMQLEDRLFDTIGTLSGGQRQALTLLMAVINKPKVLLLDEHTAALDPKSAHKVLKLTKHYVEKYKLSTVMITHSMQQALDYGNRTIMMHKGKIIEDIPFEEKKWLTSDDLLEKFNNIRKKEMLNKEMLSDLTAAYA